MKHVYSAHYRQSASHETSGGEIRNFGPADILLANDTTGKRYISTIIYPGLTVIILVVW